MIAFLGLVFHGTCPCSKLQKTQQVLRFGRLSHTVIGMLPLLSALGSLFLLRVRSRPALKIELVALRNQLTVLPRQRPGRPRLGSARQINSMAG